MGCDRVQSKWLKQLTAHSLPIIVVSACQSTRKNHFSKLMFSSINTVCDRKSMLVRHPLANPSIMNELSPLSQPPGRSARWVLSVGLGSVIFCLLLGFPITQQSAIAQSNFYNPITLSPGAEISDELSAADIPTGGGGFARDYIVELMAGDTIAVDLTSDSFDAIAILMAADGSTVAENDDGPDGSTNALLFTRITQSGRYIVRVQAFGNTGVGPFQLKVTRLRPIE